MTWLMVGTAATVATGLQASTAKNKAGLAGSTLGYTQEKLGWEENIAQNKAISEANLQSTIRTGYKVGLANLQIAQAKKLAIQNGTDLHKNVLKVMGAATANAAAAGTVGSSVDAIVSDLAMQEADAKAVQDSDYEIQTQNFDTQLHDILMSGQDALKSAATANVQRGTEFKTTGMLESVTGSLIQVGTQYIGAKMQLGLGSTPKATEATRTGRLPGTS